MKAYPATRLITVVSLPKSSQSTQWTAVMMQHLSAYIYRHEGLYLIQSLFQKPRIYLFRRQPRYVINKCLKGAMEHGQMISLIHVPADHRATHKLTDVFKLLHLIIAITPIARCRRNMAKLSLLLNVLLAKWLASTRKQILCIM